MSQSTKETKGKKAAKGDNLRVYQLAQELGLESKDVVQYCQELEIENVKTQLSTLNPEQAEVVRERVKKGAPSKSTAKSKSTAAKPVIPAKTDKIRDLSKPKALPSKTPATPAAKPATTSPSPTKSESKKVPAAIAEQPTKKTETKPTDDTAKAAVPVEEVVDQEIVTEKPAAKAKAAAPEPEPVPEPAEPKAEVIEPKPVAKPEPVAKSAPAEEPEAGSQEVVEEAEEAPADEPKPAGKPVTPLKGNMSGGGRVPHLSAGGKPSTISPSGSRLPPNLNRPHPISPRAPRPSAEDKGGPKRPGPPTARPGDRPAGGARPQPGGPSPHSTHSFGASKAPTGRGKGPMKPPTPPAPNKQVKLTPEQIQRLRDLERTRGKLSLDQVQKITSTPGDEAPAQPAQPRPSRTPFTPAKPPAQADETDDRKKRVGEVSGREARHKSRQEKGRSRGPTTDRNAIVIGAGGRVDVIEEQHGSRIKKHRGKHSSQRQNTSVISGKVEIALPITVRSLSESIGMKVGELLIKLKQHTNALYTINSSIEFEVAEIIALEREIELVAKRQDTAEDILLKEIEERIKKNVDAEHLVPRPPIVTIMGHVDHGKTSLLDKIRQEYGLHSDVVSTETGGITQVLRAWRVQKGDQSITFLDTPGHEAFTKMRARGANVTDIAVIVVSAADGIMPQTEEAVSHAKAAGVHIIVAINKVDLPGANVDKVKNQLYSLELVPEDMGGDVPVVPTSAVTGEGIATLLDSISLLSELSDLKADPDQPATGTCLEAYLSGDQGVLATILVQNGTLHKGDSILCGATFGRVRSMVDDMGLPIEVAGPSSPVRITGLDDVPDADDPFYAVDDITTAREIADKRKFRKQEANQHKFTPVSLDSLMEANAKPKISELKVILKAEARGSVEAIRRELEKLTHEEVCTRVLHAGIGAINESDVTLALTSPEDTIIIGFNVTSDDTALRLAEQRGIKVREYDIIYKLTDDVKAALEGRLKPVEEVIHLGRAVVRETFKITKVGTIAGCYVTTGTLERNARVRVIREGVVVYPSSERHVGLDSLKRFKDDVKEVREGFECGLKISGFDDVKVGDVIEAFKIEIRQRTL